LLLDRSVIAVRKIGLLRHHGFAEMSHSAAVSAQTFFKKNHTLAAPVAGGNTLSPTAPLFMPPGKG
jgi:hypothetical protein